MESNWTGADPYKGFEKNVRAEDRGPAEGKTITLAAAIRRWGRASLIHCPVGAKTIYVEVADDGGIWRPIVLDFFGGVVGYRLHKD